MSTVGSGALLKQQPHRQPVKIHLLQSLLCRAAENIFYFVEQPSWLVQEISSVQGRPSDVLHPAGIMAPCTACEKNTGMSFVSLG